MKEEFVKKWHTWWCFVSDGEQLTEAFRRELDAVIENEKQANNHNAIPYYRCDCCGCHPTVLYTTSIGRFCEKCKD